MGGDIVHRQRSTSQRFRMDGRGIILESLLKSQML